MLYAYAYANIALKRLFYRFYIVKKKFEGQFQNFKNVALFEVVVRTGISRQKIFGFYFLVLFLCYAVPSFAVKSYFCS